MKSKNKSSWGGGEGLIGKRRRSTFSSTKRNFSPRRIRATHSTLHSFERERGVHLDARYVWRMTDNNNRKFFLRTERIVCAYVVRGRVGSLSLLFRSRLCIRVSRCWLLQVSRAIKNSAHSDISIIYITYCARDKLFFVYCCSFNHFFFKIKIKNIIIFQNKRHAH